jgi:hypothetical protein
MLKCIPVIIPFYEDNRKSGACILISGVQRASGVQLAARIPADAVSGLVSRRTSAERYAVLLCKSGVESDTT